MGTRALWVGISLWLGGLSDAVAAHELGGLSTPTSDGWVGAENDAMDAIPGRLDGPWQPPVSRTNNAKSGKKDKSNKGSGKKGGSDNGSGKKPPPPKPPSKPKPSSKPKPPDKPKPSSKPAPSRKPTPATKPSPPRKPTPAAKPTPTRKPTPSAKPRTPPAQPRTPPPRAAPPSRAASRTPAAPPSTLVAPATGGSALQVTRAAPSDGPVRPPPLQVRWPQDGSSRLDAVDPDRRPAQSVLRADLPLVHQRPAFRSNDARWARPHPGTLVTYPSAEHKPPTSLHNRAHYSRWWVHPWYRWMHPTWVVVVLPWPVSPWSASWTPPPRVGYDWVPGAMAGSSWYPGYWVAYPPADSHYAELYTWVPGFWLGDAYVEGFWRVQQRRGFVWVDGTYTGEGAYIAGYWMPVEPHPAGMLWEPGFWDGTTWVAGFWRPESRDGFTWAPARFGLDGIRENGFWEPDTVRAGQVWIPGWFDGTAWNHGYWTEGDSADLELPDDWAPEVAAPDTWDAPEDEETPLALPVD